MLEHHLKKGKGKGKGEGKLVKEKSGMKGGGATNVAGKIAVDVDEELVNSEVVKEQG